MVIRSEATTHNGVSRRRYRANILHSLDCTSLPSTMGINVPYIDRIRMPGTQNVYHTVLLENPESQPAWSMEQALKDLLEFTNELMQEKFEKALKPGEHGRER